MSIEAHVMGGLGNQLFIISAMIGLARKFNLRYCLRKEHTSGITFRSTYWNTLFHKLEYTEDRPTVTVFVKEPDSNRYFDYQLPCYDDPEGSYRKEHFYMYGYFQSAKYFSHIRDEIVSLYTLPDMTLVDKKWNEVKGIHQQVNFIHVRRGDYVNLQHFHFLLPIEWYQRAYSHFDANDLFLIFSDDLTWCREQFSFIKNKEFVDEEDVISLMLMKRCDGAIIANSSFSWWGAYLGTPTKVVCPDCWFTDFVSQESMRTQPGWIVEKYKK